MFKVIIAGGRDFANYEMLFSNCCYFLDNKPVGSTEVVSGGARGADSLGERFAKEVGSPLRLFPADWQKHGKLAGPIRNKQMADYADALIAFWDGKSRGTADMIAQMKARNKPVRVVRY